MFVARLLNQNHFFLYQQNYLHEIEMNYYIITPEMVLLINQYKASHLLMTEST